MLTDPIAEETTLEALLARYEARLESLVEDFGAGHAAESAAVDEATLDAIRRGEAADLDLRDVAAVFAEMGAAPDADAVMTEVRDHLLLEMSAGMLTVDRVAADLGGDLDPKEVQGKVEGRLPMTLAEYARLHHAIVGAD